MLTFILIKTFGAISVVTFYVWLILLPAGLRKALRWDLAVDEISERYFRLRKQLNFISATGAPRNQQHEKKDRTQPWRE